MKQIILFILFVFSICSCVDKDYLEISGITGMYQGEYRHVYEFPDETLFYKYYYNPDTWEKLSTTILVRINKYGEILLNGITGNHQFAIYEGPYKVANGEYIFEGGSIKNGHLKSIVR